MPISSSRVRSSSFLSRAEVEAACQTRDKSSPKPGRRRRSGIEVPVAVSVGVAILRPGQTLEQLLAEADRLLYEAKRAGRNRVCAPAGPGGRADLALPVV
ncbi:MAG: diguanylate cyclase [Burkholderiaceae bacterium]|nr:diguanylate cyclase [Burkholderiaceae bacterium]